MVAVIIWKVTPPKPSLLSATSFLEEDELYLGPKVIAYFKGFRTGKHSVFGF